MVFYYLLQYRERSDRMPHSTMRSWESQRKIECGIRSLRSRYCTGCSRLG